MAILHIRYGLNRPKEGTRLKEYSYGAFEIEGDWTDDETHRRIKVKIATEKPGWNLTGYAQYTPANP